MVSSHYRQGPENVFPAAHDGAYAAYVWAAYVWAAYVWAVENAGELNGNAAHIAVAGESAGSKLEKAKKIPAIHIISEEEFIKMLPINK